ncbi:50S ribosomal protein L32e [Candidatus Micrarchaeota archaeon]|nr:50S ribosomal protein L32e [Candidatus Micrarchaeota archaeon]
MSIRKRKKPKFNVPNYGFMKSVKKRWRRPRGVDNKKRIRKKFAGATPRIGYRNPKSLRGVHPKGKREMIVNNVFDLNNAKDNNFFVRIAAQVGAKKRATIVEKAKLLGLTILNE